MSTTHEPGTVIVATGYCDAKYEHEHRLITDGTRAYVHTTDYHARDAEAVFLDGDLVSIDCLGDTVGEERCHGRLEWVLEDEVWTADADARALLEEYGVEMES